VPLDQSIPIFNRQVEFMDFARIQRDVFPSMHVAISFVVWLYAYRNSRRLFWIISPLILSLWVSTVYLRYHYLIDVLAGLALAPLCYWLSNFLFARFEEIPLHVALPAGWAERIPWLGRMEGERNIAEKFEERR
jgi:membrane-associated phospholipid phosphatase